MDGDGGGMLGRGSKVSYVNLFLSRRLSMKLTSFVSPTDVTFADDINGTQARDVHKAID